jgi:2-desacetyl-2-hydroxyethyl bacteriochlorophyllide A dehydrogenase
MSQATTLNTEVVFSNPGVVELKKTPLVNPPLGADDVLIETECSIVSPGTELACLSGKEWWAPLPFVPGYGSVGRVQSFGTAVKGISVGDRIFTYGRHAKYSKGEMIVLPLDPSLKSEHAVFARMAAVSITALRVADVALGDVVSVVGLGPVGNLAAQLFALSGCTVIGVDLSAKRRELATEVGIPHVCESVDQAKAIAQKLTGGKLCRTVVEATGVPAVAVQAITLAEKLGELILLGSPRGEYSADLSAFLNRAHLWDHGCITIKGAHEWRFPLKENAQGHGRHSIEGNIRCILNLITTGKLKVSPLLTHLVAPDEAQKMYDGLKNEKDRFLGVVFDWR